MEKPNLRGSPYDEIGEIIQDQSLKSPDETKRLIDYLHGLPSAKRFALDVILPDSKYYSELEKAEMAWGERVETSEENGWWRLLIFRRIVVDHVLAFWFRFPERGCLETIV